MQLPVYGWDENKGYGGPAHFAAIDEHGPSALHRGTWLHERGARRRRRRSIRPGGARIEPRWMRTSSRTTTARSSWPSYREYRDIVSQFQYVVETERRFYLANEVDLVRRDTEHDFYFELTMKDVWVWDVYRSDRFVKSVRVLTFKDVNVEELAPRSSSCPRSSRSTSSCLAGLRPTAASATPVRGLLCSHEAHCSSAPRRRASPRLHRGRRPSQPDPPRR